MSRTSLDGLLKLVSSGVSSPTVEPLYAPASLDGARRLRNLQHYFRAMLDERPRTLLVGEAPGYRGTSRTGVPFLSEQVAVAQPPLHPFINRLRHELGYEHAPRGEATSTIVWRTLGELNALPLLWAVFPDHPHQPNNLLSNRTPTPSEIAAGADTMKELIRIFDIQQVIAVGAIAKRQLESMGVTSQAVRHPSRGGAKDFRRGLVELRIGETHYQG